MSADGNPKCLYFFAVSHRWMTVMICRIIVLSRLSVCLPIQNSSHVRILGERTNTSRLWWELGRRMGIICGSCSSERTTPSWGSSRKIRLTGINVHSFGVFCWARNASTLLGLWWWRWLIRVFSGVYNSDRDEGCAVGCWSGLCAENSTGLCNGFYFYFEVFWNSKYSTNVLN